MIKYVITDSVISITDGYNTKLLRKENYEDYDQLRQILLTNDGNLESSPVVESTLYLDRFINSRTKGDIIYKDGVVYLNDEELPADLGGKLLTLLRNDLPYDPLVTFWLKLKSNPYLNSSSIEALSSVVGSSTIPLTYDGNLVLYKRASWNNTNTDASLSGNYADFKNRWGKPFVSGEVITSDDSNGLQCGSLEWIMSFCPDAGAIFDLEVNPAEVMDVQNVRNSSLYVNSYRNISKLPEQLRKEEQLVVLNTMTNSLGDSVLIRQPYSDASIRQYLHHLLSSSNLNSFSITKTNTPVLVTSGC